MPTSPAPKTRIARAMTLFGVLGLLLLMPAWILWLSPPLNWSPWFLLALSTLPLLPPLAGLFGGRPYTYAWSGFLALMYFTHGVVEAWADSDSRGLALTEIGLAVMLYVGSMLYARWRSQELKPANDALQSSQPE